MTEKIQEIIDETVKAWLCPGGLDMELGIERILYIDIIDTIEKYLIDIGMEKLDETTFIYRYDEHDILQISIGDVFTAEERIDSRLFNLECEADEIYKKEELEESKKK